MSHEKDPICGQSRRLEDMFFLKEEKKLIEKLREMERMKVTRAALREVSGIHNEVILQKLIDLKVEPQTVSSLSLVPLVMTAWADGEVDEGERKAVLAAAGGSGVKPGSPEYEILECWMARRPAPELLDAWAHYVRGLCEKLSAEEVRLLKDDLMGQALSVARASGGILGFGDKVSAKEKAMIKRLERAFEG
ncbi:MAG: hypothetical protein HY922_00210 [Elusimicrobia bacterium]|nr:hypothetical protein [Elusimicrobiota bacterium]